MKALNTRKKELKIYITEYEKKLSFGAFSFPVFKMLPSWVAHFHKSSHLFHKNKSMDRKLCTITATKAYTVIEVVNVTCKVKEQK